MITIRSLLLIYFLMLANLSVQAQEEIYLYVFPHYVSDYSGKKVTKFLTYGEDILKLKLQENQNLIKDVLEPALVIGEIFSDKVITLKDPPLYLVFVNIQDIKGKPEWTNLTNTLNLSNAPEALNLLKGQSILQQTPKTDIQLMLTLPEADEVIKKILLPDEFKLYKASLKDLKESLVTLSDRLKELAIALN